MVWRREGWPGEGKDGWEGGRDDQEGRGMVRRREGCEGEQRAAPSPSVGAPQHVPALPAAWSPAALGRDAGTLWSELLLSWQEELWE